MPKDLIPTNPYKPILRIIKNPEGLLKVNLIVPHDQPKLEPKQEPKSKTPSLPHISKPSSPPIHTIEEPSILFDDEVSLIARLCFQCWVNTSPTLFINESFLLRHQIFYFRILGLND